MKSTQMRKHLLAVFLLLVMAPVTVGAQGKDDLQEYINSLSFQKTSITRADDDLIIIDLSKFEDNDTIRTQTLDVLNGKRIRFINGKLTRAESLDGAILRVCDGSYVEIGTGATIDASISVSQKEAILMDGGELVVTGGSVYGKRNEHSTSDADPVAVLITSPQDVFRVTSENNHPGLVSGPIDCQTADAQITIEDGIFHTGTADYGTINTRADVNLYPGQDGNHWLHINLLGDNNTVTLADHLIREIVVTAPNRYEGSTLVKGGNIELNETDLGFITWGGTSDYTFDLDKLQNIIKLYYADLGVVVKRWPYWPYPTPQPCGCGWNDPIPVNVPCNGMEAKEDIEFPDDDLYWTINGKPEEQEDEYDCEGQVDQGENDVVIRPNAKVRIRWVRWRGCGCRKHFYVWGTLYIKWRVWFSHYWRFIHLKPGGKVIIEDLYGDSDETVIYQEGGETEYSGGECSGGEYGWYCEGGVIYVRGGKLSGGKSGGWTGPNGKSYHHGGTVHGGIHNYGWHYWYGGYCTGGGTYTIYNHKGGRLYYHGGKCSDGGKIWNEGDMYIDGSGDISCGDIYCVRGCRIYIIKRVTCKLRFVIEEKDIIVNEPIILGGDGYRLTEEDCNNIEVVLPDGYGWRYDPDSGGIIIYEVIVDLQPYIVKHYPYVPGPNGPCGCKWEEAIPINIPCTGIKMKEEVEFPDDDLYWAINGRSEGQEESLDCEGQIEEGEYDIKIPKNSKVRFRWIRWWGCGCQKHIYVWGTLYIEWRTWFYNYWRFIHVMPGGKVIIKDLYGECEETIIHLEGGEAEYSGGDSKGSMYGWYCTEGVVYVRGGKLSGGTAGGWTGPNGKSHHYDGTVHGGIHNYGWHYWYGGNCTGGGTYTIYNYKGGHFYYYGGTCSDSGKIWNEGNLYIDGSGSISCGDIYCILGCRIYIIKKLTYKLRFFFEEKDIVLDEPVILGGEGYMLTEEDCKQIEIVLPDGFDWRYDPTSGGIIIFSTNAVSSIRTDAQTVGSSYDTAGRKAGEKSKGVVIRRMNDKTTRKQIVK